MPVITRLLALRIPLVGAAAACLVLAGVIAVRCVQSAGVRDELAATERKLQEAVKAAGALESEAAFLRRDLAAQSAAVQQWKDQAAAQGKRAEQAAQAAAQVRTVTRTKVVQVMAEPVPSSCDGALQWGLQQAQDLGRAWEAGQ